VHAAAKLIPVVIDESLTGQEAFLQALQMGYSGAALKACKGQSPSLLMAALGQKRKVFLCVQDLTCPGASLVHSVSLAAHVGPVQAIEANARQYVPAANRGWEKRFPGIFAVKDGLVRDLGNRWARSRRGSGVTFRAKSGARMTHEPSESEFLNKCRCSVEVAKPNPPGAHDEIHDARPAQVSWPIGPRFEIDLLIALQFRRCELLCLAL
jgi:hypothetical protein